MTLVKSRHALIYACRIAIGSRNGVTRKEVTPLKKMFIEDIKARIRNLEKAIDEDPYHREYLEGQLSAYRYVIAMMAEIEED